MPLSKGWVAELWNVRNNKSAIKQFPQLSPVTRLIRRGCWLRPRATSGMFYSLSSYSNQPTKRIKRRRGCSFESVYLCTFARTCRCFKGKNYYLEEVENFSTDGMKVFYLWKTLQCLIKMISSLFTILPWKKYLLVILLYFNYCLIMDSRPATAPENGSMITVSPFMTFFILI